MVKYAKDIYTNTHKLIQAHFKYSDIRATKDFVRGNMHKIVHRNSYKKMQSQ